MVQCKLRLGKKMTKEKKLDIEQLLDSLEGIRVYNIITKLSQTKYPYVGVDGSGNFWNIDSKLTKIKKQSNGKR